MSNSASRASGFPAASQRDIMAGIRSAFLDWFEQRDHQILPSAPLTPQDDPSILFVNSGMVPFKPVFTGRIAPPAPRAATVQKCVRAGGKHNDLDNVGVTSRHHTFFEMLGNFSFGDYFKEEAILMAWGLVTDIFELPPERLVLTVHEDDSEARELWRKISGLPESRIIGLGVSDNFWSMGATGPCGPCSEIFYDHGEQVAGGLPGSADAEGDRFVEIWNLVFMQFEQGEQERLPLPRPSIDTGMGLERMTAVIEGVYDNYDISLFRHLIASAAEIYSVGESDGDAAVSLRILADHIRACAFLLADGVVPSNEGRGYVLRRIMRRAMRRAHMLGSRRPLMHKLAAPLIEQMGGAWPELVRARHSICSEIEEEETRFQETLERGLTILDEAAAKLRPGADLPGEIAFRLYDTYGFPLDLTGDILRDRGHGLDRPGFDAAMSRQRQRARDTRKKEATADDGWLERVADMRESNFVGYERNSAASQLEFALGDGQPVERLATGQEAELIFGLTPFYAEAGGQSADHGLIEFACGGVFAVRDVRKRGGKVFSHMGVMRSGEARVGSEAILRIDTKRRAGISAAHSATHLLHAALRDRLGLHVAQKGSLVECERLRFDFSHREPLSREQIEAIETDINAVIADNAPTVIADMEAEQAIAAGALALFGEKYASNVRVLSIGRRPDSDKPYSMELCGGSHVSRTGDIGMFAITGETGIAAGVRRIEAVVGGRALAFWRGRARLLDGLAERLKTAPEALPERIEALIDERKKLERELEQARISGHDDGVVEKIAGIDFLLVTANGAKAGDMRINIDRGKQRLGSAVIMCCGVIDGKAALAIGVCGEAMSRFDAVELARLAAGELGGSGGGRPDLAMAGGPDGNKIAAAIEAVRSALAGGA